MNRPIQSPRITVSVWRMASRQLARDFRAGELRLLLVADGLAVAALTAVGLFLGHNQSGP